MTETKPKKPVNRLVLVIVIAVLIAGINYLCYPVLLDIKLATVAVPVARVELSPYTVIETADISYIQVPKTYLPEHVIMDSASLKEQMVKPEHTIAAGAFFYDTALCSPKQLAGQLDDSTELPQWTYSLAVDELSSTNDNLKAGQFVDLFFTGQKLDNGIKKTVMGLLCEHVAIAAVYGSESNSASTTGHIRYVVLRLDQAQYDYVSRAVELGSITPAIGRYAASIDYQPDNYYNTALTKAYIDAWSAALRNR